MMRTKGDIDLLLIDVGVTMYDSQVILNCLFEVDTFLHVNKAWEYWSGYSQKELCAQPIWDFIHPDDIEPTKEQAVFYASLEDRHKYLFHNRYKRKSGGYFDCYWVGQNLPPREDEVVLATAIPGPLLEQFTEIKINGRG